METNSNSHIYTQLKRILTMLPEEDNASLYRRLLEAVGAALLQGENPEKLARRIRRKRSPKTLCFTALTAAQAEKDILEMRQLRKLARAHPFIPGARKLERYHGEITALRAGKASYRDIQLWLFAKKGLVVSHHSVQRYLQAVLNQHNSAD
jgi:hypothetical protein